MKILRNSLYPNFKGALLYTREVPMDRAEVMCREIAAEIARDSVLKKPHGPKKAAQSKDIPEKEPDKAAVDTVPVFNDSDFLLKLRKASGIEEEPDSKKTDDDGKKRFTMPACGSKIDIRA
ncbi:MAG: hypothetical protein OSJ27_05040 [Candidatus Gastranaerophilales bacterium]|nr:hypothetical protein [Candidatus Gastranaerophilales bacterium]